MSDPSQTPIEPNATTQPPADPPVAKPGAARTRLPFESDEAIKRRGGPGFVLVYALGAIALVGLGGYMAMIQAVPMTDPRVWAPVAVGVWFVVRAVMTQASSRRED